MAYGEWMRERRGYASRHVRVWQSCSRRSLEGELKGTCSPAVFCFVSCPSFPYSKMPMLTT